MVDMVNSELLDS